MILLYSSNVLENGDLFKDTIQTNTGIVINLQEFRQMCEKQGATEKRKQIA